MELCHLCILGLLASTPHEFIGQIGPFWTGLLRMALTASGQLTVSVSSFSTVVCASHAYICPPGYPSNLWLLYLY